MADFISSLNGNQMDAALMDMAEHNSEAYAVGERNGVAVGTDDVTYHNNARYYASQAQSIAPASVTEAVRWDIAQTALTDANKAQARENIDAGKNGAWTNHNLLMNSWFTVNQRGQASYTSGTTVDRWKFSAQPSTVTVTTNGITLARGGISGTPMQFVQQVEADVWNSLIGRKATASVMLDDGSVYSTTATIAADMTSTAATIGNTGFAIDIRGISNSGYRWIRIQSPYNAAASSINIRAVKFEVGEMSTIANDAAPEYGTELMECQRYFARIKGDPMAFGYITGSGTSSRLLIPLPVAMRTNPTVSISGTFHLRSYNATSNVTSITAATPAFTGAGVAIACSGFSGATTGPCALYADTSADYIDLSAEPQ